MLVKAIGEKKDLKKTFKWCDTPKGHSANVYRIFKIQSGIRLMLCAIFAKTWNANLWPFAKFLG